MSATRQALVEAAKDFLTLLEEAGGRERVKCIVASLRGCLSPVEIHELEVELSIDVLGKTL